MPKNQKARKNSKNKTTHTRTMVYAEEGQEYAQVTKVLGNRRMTCQCLDGIERICVIRGSMRKKYRVNLGDIVIIGLREFQDDKADIMYLYTPDEVKLLHKQGEIPPSMKTITTDVGATVVEEEQIIFENEEETEEEEEEKQFDIDFI